MKVRNCIFATFFSLDFGNRFTCQQYCGSEGINHIRHLWCLIGWIWIRIHIRIRIRIQGPNWIHTVRYLSMRVRIRNMATKYLFTLNVNFVLQKYFCIVTLYPALSACCCSRWLWRWRWWPWWWSSASACYSPPSSSSSSSPSSSWQSAGTV